MNKFLEISESVEDAREMETPPKKKLKQARLPFHILSPAVKSTSPPLKSSNKRKLSESSEDIKVIKVIKPNGKSPHAETKENVCSTVTKALPLSAVSKTSIECSSNKNKDLEVKAANEEKEEFKGTNEKKKIKGAHRTNKEIFEKAQPENVIILSDSETEPETIGTLANNDQNSTNSTNSEEPEQMIDNLCTENVKIEYIKVTAGANKAVLKTITSYGCQETDPEAIGTLAKTNLNSADSVNSEEPEQKVDNLCKEKVKFEDIKVTTDASKAVLKTIASDDCQETIIKNITKENEEINISDKTLQEEMVSNSNVNVTPEQKCVRSKQSKRVAVDDQEQTCTTSQMKTPLKNELSLLGESANVGVCAMPKVKKLTPKQAQKQLEFAKKKEEKEKQRQERERKKAEEKEEKLRQKQEKEEQKRKEKEEKEEQKKKEREEKEEQKKKEKEEKEEQKRKEREEKEKRKQMEIELRNEEKRAKDEEKRKREEQRQAEAAAFTSFFLPKKSELKMDEETAVKSDKTFMPFEVKADMRLAPNCRIIFTLELKREMDKALELQSLSELYLDEIRNKHRIPKSSSKTWSLSDFKNDIIVLDEEDEMDVAESNIIETHPAIGKLPRPKLLQFCENRRPPYWGTWRKQTNAIGPLKPFGRDEKMFDYEVDSDDEWEEEEPGESLHGSDDEKESEDEYEVDNDFFVPHGYLSDEENEEEDQTPEMQKTKLRLLELEFEEEMKQKTERLKPRLIGCIWIDPKTADFAGGQLLKLLSPYTTIYSDGPILTHASELGSGCGSPENQPASPVNSTVKRRKFPDAAIPTLIKLSHGNVNRREFLVKEFLAHWCKESQKLSDSVHEDSFAEDSAPPKPSPSGISKASISNKIKELANWIACPDEGPMFGRMCWYVPEETRIAHDLSELSVPNSWVYICKPKRLEITENQTSNTNISLCTESTPKQLITKFTKVMSENERKKQFKSIANVSRSPDTVNVENDLSASKAPRKLIFPPATKSNSSKEQKQIPEQQQQKTAITTASTPKSQRNLKASNNILTKYIKTQNSKIGESSNAKRKKPLQVTTFNDDCIVLSD